MWNQKWAGQNGRENTAFTIGEGLWRYTVIPFGLPNAPETNSSSFAWTACLVCLDDDIACMHDYRPNCRRFGFLKSNKGERIARATPDRFKFQIINHLHRMENIVVSMFGLGRLFSIKHKYESRLHSVPTLNI